jgi:hypothetical protein
VQDIDWLMERNNLSNFANHGIQVNCQGLDVIVVVSLFSLSLMLMSSYCHSSCFLPLVMDTSQLQGRLEDASILAPFSGSWGHDDDHSDYDNGNGIGIGTEYYGITTMRRLRKGFERLSRHNQQSE